MSYKHWDFWNLESSEGRQVWRFNLPDVLSGGDGFWETEEGIEFLVQHSQAFVFDKSSNPNSADRVLRGQMTGENELAQENESERDPAGVLKKGISYFGSLQTADGNWAGDYGGPLFLLPGLVLASYITNTPFPPPHQALIKRYMLNHQNTDGGWGLHIEGSSTMFGTVMQYVALRLLGGKNDESELKRGRRWILDHGGAAEIPSWGKFYLSILGVYEWEGNNSLLPEMWLIPRRLPFHPGRYWCHCRMVYLPMSYCFGAKVLGPITDLVQEIREEIYPVPYHEVDWTRARNQCSETDRFIQSKSLLRVLLTYLNKYESYRISSLRRKALGFAMHYVEAEDEHTNYIDIGPVNKIINSLCIWHAYGSDSPQFKAHVNRWYDYLWLAEDGMKMSGYNGSQLWDTAFGTQAILESGMERKFKEVIRKSYSYLDQAQVKTEVREPGKFFRHPSVGGWPFSTVDHGWPITDCTAEGLLSAMLVHQAQVGLDKSISDQRLRQAADLLLSFQNKSGGWATYELTRAPNWLELLNPSEVFGDIMIDYSYTECTSACIRSLAMFSRVYPDHRPGEIENAIEGGTRFIQSKQNPNGSWIGSWGVCFTYGTWFGVEGLIAARDSRGTESNVSFNVERACAFLISKQNPDGGWGESHQSCIQKKYVSIESQVVNTSWALLALMAANSPEEEAIRMGIKFLQDSQFSNGDWPQERISGVFNSNCMITYANYRNIFPIWALGRYRKLYG